MTHNERVLDLLSDGLPHSHHEGYRLNVMLHSRVADLRKQGHDIACWREGDSYFYRLSLQPASPRPEAKSLLGGADWSEDGNASGRENLGLSGFERTSSPPSEQGEPVGDLAVSGTAANRTYLGEPEQLSPEPFPGQLTLEDAA